MHNLKCILIEDNKVLSESLEMALIKQGYKVTTVSNGEKALNLLQQEAFEIVLLDLVLPGMSGEAFLKRLREVSDIPVIVMSVKNSKVDKAIGLELGADDYIEKPLSIIELNARIKSVLRRYRSY